MTVQYSTNWMGPAGMWWFRDNGYTRTVTKTLQHDSKITDKKAGDVIECEEITEQWYGGRIDVYGLPEDEYYNGKSEMALPIMDGPSYGSFSRWLEKFETETQWSLDQLVAEYEKTHDKIRWHDYEKSE